MKSKVPTLSQSRRSRTILALALAGILSAVGTGSYISWSAAADQRPAVSVDNDSATSRRSIDIDSLYSAKAAESTPTDSSYTTPLSPDRTIAGRVSWYGPGFDGRRTASGERFNKMGMSAAHKTLPFGSLVRVVDVATGKGILVRVNDRGPYCGGRVMDLSEGAARRLGIMGRGTASTKLELFPVTKHGTENVSAMTFDTEGRAVLPHGYSIKISEVASFEEAESLQHKLQEKGYKEVYLTQLHRGGKVSYQISLGLFSADYLCNSLLAELDDQFSSAAIVRFDHGTTNGVNLASKPSPDAGL